MTAFVVNGALAAVGGLFVNMVAKGYHRTKAEYEANLQESWTCKMPLGATGRAAYCAQIELRASRPFALQLVIDTIEGLPWCGPWDCPTNATSPVMQVVLVALVLGFVLSLVQLLVIRTGRRRRSPYYAVSGQPVVVKA